MLPSSLDHCQQWFAADGRLAHLLEGFQPRNGQLQMAAFILDAIVDKQDIVCEAGTGIGKTLAYLLPTLDSSKKTIVSTATKTLQRQLFDKDIPLASQIFGGGVKTFLLKGKVNYLSFNRLHNTLETTNALAPKHYKQLKLIKKWAELTETGDRSECIDIADNDLIWQYVCFHANDSNDSNDFYTKARREAKEADLLIINHHLLCTELSNAGTVKQSILDSFQHLIIDEAHHLNDIATMVFSNSLSHNHIQEITENCNQAIFFLPEEVRVPFIEQLNNLTQLSQKINEFFFKYQVGRYSWQRFIEHTNIRWVNSLTQITKALIQLFKEHEIDEQDKAKSAQKSLQHSYDFCQSLEKINRAESPDELKDSTCWLEIRKNGFFCLYLSPLSVAEKLTNYRQELKKNWTYTSATLTIEDRFDHLKQSLGLDETVKTKQCHSPFDYSKQVIWYQPPALLESTFQPQSSHKKISPALKNFMDEAIQICNLTAGQAFLLFCSYRALAQAHNYLKEIIKSPEQKPFSLFIQGEASNKKLLSNFTSSQRGILLGTSSFWEGVDVRGDALRLVAIEKLPFPPHKDPLNEARALWFEKKQKNIFQQDFLPRAVILLKQGLGRLIRDVQDTGIVLIGDNRIFTKSYGQAFINSLPNYNIIKDFKQLEQHWQTNMQ